MEHATEWSKLAELLPQLSREYSASAMRYRILLSVLILLPPLLIPLEAAKWFGKQPLLVAFFILLYLGACVAMLYYTGKWVDNLKAFGVERIAEDRLCSRTLDRIERDSGKSGEMSFEELYLTDGSGLERRTRKQIIYAENDIEVNMDRGQKLFANNNVPLMINTGIVLVFCLYIAIGAPFLAIDWQLWTQQALLFMVPLGIFFIQTNFRQHQLNQVLSLQLLEYITDDDAREAADNPVETLDELQEDAEAEQQESVDVTELELSPEEFRQEEGGEEGVQAQA
ncbi:hypothetical protein KDL44_10280 [bacterium]|nr:hypothetical protein [bacterium]